MQEKVRINFIDIAKIIGMFFIVLGHILRGGIITTWLYSFHVPLFFFLSGLTFHYTNSNLKSFLCRRAKTLLIPFFIWSLISICLYSLISPFLSIDISSHSRNLNPLLKMLLGYCDSNSPLWFLPCLFLSDFLLWIVLNLKQKYGIYMLALACLISLLSCFCWPLITEKVIFWNAQTALILLPFPIAGYLIRDKLISLHCSFKEIIFSVLFLMVGGTVGTLANHQIGYLGCYYGNPLVFYFAAFLSVIGITYLCKILPRRPLITYCGKNTIYVLVMHKFVITFFMVCPIIKNYMTYNNPFICVITAIVTMVVCYFVGWILSFNKKLQVLFGKMSN